MQILPFSPPARARAMRTLLGGLGLLALFVIAPSGRAMLAPVLPAVPPAPAVVQSDAEDPVYIIPAGTGRIVPIYITALGFTPDTLVFQAGAHRLMLLNEAGLPDTDLTGVVRHADTQQIVLSGTLHDRWSQVHDVVLVPGAFLVTEASHPAWQCHVTVVP
jgi:hypothetical protein